MPVVFVCPSCHHRVSVSRRFVGVDRPCPACGAPFHVPAISDELFLSLVERVGVPSAEVLASYQSMQREHVARGEVCGLFQLLCDNGVLTLKEESRFRQYAQEAEAQKRARAAPAEESALVAQSISLGADEMPDAWSQLPPIEDGARETGVTPESGLTNTLAPPALSEERDDLEQERLEIERRRHELEAREQALERRARALAAAESRTVTHPLNPKDRAFVAATRAEAEPKRGQLRGVAARRTFDQIMERILPAPGVTSEPDTVGGIAGWWLSPPDAREGEAILYLHGGWYVWGTARAYRKFAGHFAARAGVRTFVPDYRLAPEHPFPAALVDAQACYQGLRERGARRIALVGDSAGGGLALALASLLKPAAGSRERAPVGVVALSPLADLTLTGASWETRAVADAYFTREQGEEMVALSLGDHDSRDPLASPLFGELAGLPPVRIHVGEDEVLLDDSRRYLERALAAGVDARLDVWQSMLHVFPMSVGALRAAGEALDAIGAFLKERLRG